MYLCQFERKTPELYVILYAYNYLYYAIKKKFKRNVKEIIKIARHYFIIYFVPVNSSSLNRLIYVSLSALLIKSWKCLDCYLKLILSKRTPKGPGPFVHTK